MGVFSSLIRGDIGGAFRALRPPSRGRPQSALGTGPTPPPAPQTDWAAIFAAERAATEKTLNQMRVEAEAQRQREEEQRQAEEARRVQEEHNARQIATDQTALENYGKMQQAAAAQAVGGVGSVNLTSPTAAAPGLSPVGGRRARSGGMAYSPAMTSPVATEAGNLPMAPEDIGLGGGASLDWLRALYGR